MAKQVERSITVADLHAAVAAKHPGFDVRINGTDLGHYEITVPGGSIAVDRDKVESLTSMSDLRAYIDTLKVK